MSCNIIVRAVRFHVREVLTLIGIAPFLPKGDSNGGEGGEGSRWKLVEEREKEKLREIKKEREIERKRRKRDKLRGRGERVRVKKLLIDIG